MTRIMMDVSEKMNYLRLQEMHHIHPKRQCNSINLYADTSRKMRFSYNKPFNHGKPRGKKGVGTSPQTLEPASIKNVFPTAQQNLVGQGLLIIKASRSHTHTHTHTHTHSVGFL